MECYLEKYQHYAGMDRQEIHFGISELGSKGMEWFAADRLERLTVFLPPIFILLIIVLIKLPIKINVSKTI